MPLRYYELRRRLFRAMFRLPDRQRHILFMRWNQWWFRKIGQRKEFATFLASMSR